MPQRNGGRTGDSQRRTSSLRAGCGIEHSVSSGRPKQVSKNSPETEICSSWPSAARVGPLSVPTNTTPAITPPPRPPACSAHKEVFAVLQVKHDDVVHAGAAAGELGDAVVIDERAQRDLNLVPCDPSPCGPTLKVDVPSISASDKGRAATDAPTPCTHPAPTAQCRERSTATAWWPWSH